MSWMRSLCSFSGQSSPSGTESSTIRYGREKKEQSLLLSQVHKRRKGAESIRNENFALLFWSDFSIGNGEFPCRIKEKKGTESVMDEKFALLLRPELTIKNGEFQQQV
jgi:hypothetical protein